MKSSHLLTKGLIAQDGYKALGSVQIDYRLIRFSLQSPVL